MNILPFVIALILILSVLTIEKLEKFKNQTIVQKEYQTFLKTGERQKFNQRQKNFVFKRPSFRRLSFRLFTEKKERERDEKVTKQYRLLAIELMKVLYGEALFFKHLEQKRPNFLEELLDAIQNAAENFPSGAIKKIKDIVHLDLGDSELQHALYHMLKGTISREELEKLKEMSPSMKEKAYVSLFTFINYDGAKGMPPIEIQFCTHEILKAIFESDEVVNAIVAKRKELAANPDAGVMKDFEDEFKNKLREGLDPPLFNFKITSKKDLSLYD